MSKTRDNSPELDYFELRRRHEEYKRARSAPQPEKNSVEERLERQVAQQKAKPEPVVVAEETPINDAQDALEVEAKAAPVDAFEEAIEENYEAFEDDMDYDEEADEEAVNPNPFDSFIRFFNGVKSNRAARRQKDDELEDLDLDDLTDEELAELEDEDLDDLDEYFEDEPAPAKPRFSLRRNVRSDAEEDEEEFTAAEDIEDLEEDPRPVRKAAPRFADADADEDFDDEDFEGLDDEDFDDEDFDDEDFEDDDAPRKGGFKKFVNLFVTRVDEDEEDEDFDEEDLEDDELEDIDFDDEDLEEIEEEEEEPVRRGFFSRGRKNKAHQEEDEELYEDFASEMQIRPEGGQSKMDELNKPAFETAAQADVIETSGMSRRERRERAMRLAAEEAARKAEEEALAKAKAAPVEPLFTDLEVKAAPVDMAAFEGAPETDLIVETTAEEIIETVDEPTREFTPVSMRDVQEAAEKALFDTDVDEDIDEDDEDEEEIIEKPRRGLFGRKRAKDEDEDDDFDDDDDDEDDEYEDEDDDDEDEIVEKKPRRGLFGRKRAKDEDDDEDSDDEDDDEDDEDLDDSYDDEDDDDEYDEYDDDEEDDYDEDDDEDEYDDDDYDDDDDEPRRSFGHHLIGVFKIILALVLVLLVLVIGLNFHYFVTGENVILEKTHEILGDSSASDVLCFGYVMREAMPAAETADEAASETETVVEPTALPQTEIAIPDLSNNGEVTETPVVEAAPVIEAAPAVAEAPVTSGSIG